MFDLDALRHRLDELKESVRLEREALLTSAAESGDQMTREIAENLISGRMTLRDMLQSPSYAEILGERFDDANLLDEEPDQDT